MIWKEPNIHSKETLSLSTFMYPAASMGFETKLDNVDHVYGNSNTMNTCMSNVCISNSSMLTEIDHVKNLRSHILGNRCKQLPICACGYGSYRG